MEMEMTNSITISSIEESKEMIIEDNEILERHPECCIYRVPKGLRRINEDAYTPQVISIGPLHHGKHEFADMEKQKIIYKREFGKRITTEKWQQFINFIEKEEKRIHNCYGESCKLTRIQFVTMILYDAVFIIEYFLKFWYGGDFLLCRGQTVFDINVDLQLLENQLPFFVLDGLYKSAFSNGDGEADPSFLALSCAFFRHCEFNKAPAQVEVKHFTDLRRYFMTETHPDPESRDFSRDLPCAVKLHESGVKFNGTKGKCLLDIRFEKKQLRIPCLKVRELQIPLLNMEDQTECLIRNVMALEQCHYPQESLVCNYIDLMDMLIDTEEDVNLLVQAGIISNYLGENARIANLFNKLCLEISCSHSYYSDIIRDLKTHHDNPWNHATPTLKRVYFSDLWRGTGTVAAIVLLFLTLMQTICSILQL